LGKFKYFHPHWPISISIYVYLNATLARGNGAGPRCV
jgi:hypothetical protein